MEGSGTRKKSEENGNKNAGTRKNTDTEMAKSPEHF